MNGEPAVGAEAPGVDPAMPIDPELPSRLLDDILARSEFAGHVADAGNPLGGAIERLAAAWSRLPAWVDGLMTGAVLAVAAALVLWLLADVGVFRRRRRRAGVAPGEAPGGSARGISASELFSQGRTAHAEGRWAEAIVLLFRAMVARLIERGLLLDDPSRTNLEHLRDLARSRREADALRSALPAFERVRYGESEPLAGDADGALAATQPLFPTEHR